MIIKIASITEKSDLIKSEYALLSRNQRMKFDKISQMKKEESLLGRALVRQIFVEKGMADSFYFKKTAKGRPFTVPHFSEFSISHSHGTVAVCVGDKKVGIDIEAIRDIDLNLSKKVCTKKEIDWIFAVTDRAEQIKRFYVLWTLKESYMKVTGEGMKIPFTDIEFEIFENYKAYCCIKGYDFTVYVTDEYILSTAEMR